MPKDKDKNKDIHKLSDNELDNLAGGAYYSTREKRSGFLGSLGFNENVYHVVNENNGRVTNFKSEEEAKKYDRSLGGHGKMSKSELDSYLYAKKKHLI
jgi:hypothetical protein